jgi:hypothetical protein
MIWLTGLLYLTGFAPLALAWRANRRTSLSHALAWALAAWGMGGLVVVLAGMGWHDLLAPARYLTLCLIGGAGVAVLGARRPGVVAWNFVVLGLLAVFLLWLAEGYLASGGVELSVVRGVFLSATLAVGILNYLPTRLGLAAVILAGAMAVETTQLIQGRAGEPALVPPVTALLALAPWAGYLMLRRPEANADDVTARWRSFRDAYGFFWAQRLREQFNRSAANHGWPVELGWNGLRRHGDHPEESVLSETLQALMKRFGVAE